MLESGAGGSSLMDTCPLNIAAKNRVSRGDWEPVRGTALTERQRQALEAIRESVRERGMAPTHTELADAMGLPNASAVSGYLAALARKGWISVLPSVDRGIRLLREGAPILDAAHLPAVAAGNPTVVEECRNLPRVHDFESLSRQFEATPDFFVRVEGDSLDKVGFTTGDIVAVRHQPEARNGDIVLARIGEEVTLKRYEQTGPHTVEFQPESTNPEHKPIRVDTRTDDVAIVAVVVGAIIGTRRAAD